MKKKCTLLFLISGILTLFMLISSSFAQEKETGTEFEYSAFEIMEKVSNQLTFPKGLIKTQLTLTNQKGQTVLYKSTMYQKELNTLFLFNSLRAGRVLKLLFNNAGLDIYVYHVHERRLFHKRAGDRFDKILKSGFYFVDFSNSPFLENFTPRIAGMEKNKKGDLLRIENIPLDRGKYSKLNVLVDPAKEYQIRRIDYFDKTGVLLKSLELSFSQLPIKIAKNKTIKKEYATKWDMMDMSQGTISTYEFFLVDQTARLDNSLFKKENIQK